MKKRGWVVWVWGKMGSMLVFMGIMLMLLSTYSVMGNSQQSDAANQLSRELKNLMLDAYDSAGDMNFEYALSKSLNGEDYSVEVLDKEGDMVGVVTRTKSGTWGATGGSSLSVRLSEGSFGLLKDYGQWPVYICITKHGDMLYLERSKCS